MIDAMERQLRSDHRGKVVLGITQLLSIGESHRQAEISRAIICDIAKTFGFRPTRWLSRVKLVGTVTNNSNMDFVYTWEFVAIPPDEPLFSPDDWVAWACQE